MLHFAMSRNPLTRAFNTAWFGKAARKAHIGEDRANVDDDELADFKKLAQAYSRMTDTELRAALNQGDLLELCDEE